MTPSTRVELLQAAIALFAERGFDGVSIAKIAGELGLTKQALLHHFSTKEKLYGEVLDHISQEFAVLRARAIASSADPEEQLFAYLLALARGGPEHNVRSRILMRELLDNKRRASTAGVWYLKPFLEDLIGRLRVLPDWASASEAEAFAAVYQLLGAINYYAISEPTLRAIVGSKRYNALDDAFEPAIASMIRRVFRRSSE